MFILLYTRNFLCLKFHLKRDHGKTDKGMDVNEFRRRGEEMIDYMVDYLESLSQRRIVPNVTPGFLYPLLPKTAPEKGESFEKIMDDLEKHIMQGLIHWQHPNFHGYFPANSSYPSILGEMISDTIGCTTYNWNVCRCSQEIEYAVLDWYGKMIGLPDEFLHSGVDSVGNGLLHNSSSDCLFLTMITARQNALKKLRLKYPSMDTGNLLQFLVAYCSEESHSCVEKAAMVALVNIRVLDTDKNYRLRGETFAKAVEEDIKRGLLPFFASITIGTTSCCSCDPIDEIGPICKTNGIWLNVDAAYAGTALICPEYKHLLKGIEYASTIIVNPVKWMLTSVDGACIWTKDSLRFEEMFSVKSDMFHYNPEESWYQPTKRFQALKLWFVIRNYGVEGLQKYIRKHVDLAKIFEKYVRSDERFELFASQFGLVCFRLKGSNTLNKKLLTAINNSGKLHLTACFLHGKYTIRFVVCSKSTTEEHITSAWSVFCEFAEELLEAAK